MLREQMQEVDLLILGAGWTSTFLIPQLKREGITYAATTTTGHDNTIPFKFDPYSVDPEPYKRLPSAKTVLVTFPLKGQGQSMTIVGLYRNAHGAKNNWIQLGVTSIWNQLPDDWSTEDSPYDKSDERGMAEDELMVEFGGCSLNLCGLYGGTRVPRTWLPRLGQSKDDVKKRGAVHFVHGEDVARAIVATHKNFTPGKRWLIADLRVYDWYDLIMSFSAMTEEQERAASVEDRALRQQFSKWVGELMVEEGVRALPREMNQLGRKLDSPFLEVHRHINLTSRSAAYIAVQLTFHINCEAPMHFPEAIKCWLTAPQTIKIFMKLSRHTNSTSPIAVPLSGPIGYVSQVPGSNALC